MLYQRQNGLLNETEIRYDIGETVSTRYRRGFPFIPTLSSVTYTTGSTGGDSGAPIILESREESLGFTTLAHSLTSKTALKK